MAIYTQKCQQKWLKINNRGLEQRCLRWKKIEIWLCEETSNKHGWIPVKYLNVLPHNRTQKQLKHFAKILPTSYFGYFRHIWPLPSKKKKKKIPTCRNFDVHLHTKNELPSELFWDIVKILQTYYFEYFENAWSYLAVNDSITLYASLMPEVLKSTWRKLWCSSAN